MKGRGLATSFANPWHSDWQPEFVGTLMFLRRVDEVLLIHKKTGHGAGRVNAPGGKLQAGETLLQCACRETFEEVGITVGHAQCKAELRFIERDGDQWLGFAYVADEYQGVAQESAEASPFWCRVGDIPYQDMWPDDALWLPRVLADHGLGDAPMVANFLFDNERLIAHQFVT